MHKIAFLFPGQGSQAVGMGSHLFDEARSLFDQAGAILGWDLIQLCREGPEEKLRQTEFAQPALYVTGYAAFFILKHRGAVPVDSAYAVAGHSIGEYSALAAAQVFDFAEGLRLVQKRAELMNQATQGFPGAMAAVLRLTRPQVEQICSRASQQGVCVPVNFNTPDQIVISGERAAVEKASDLAREKGGKVLPLKVSGGFHSPLMQQAAEEMRRVLEHAAFRDAAAPVSMNVDGKIRTGGREIKEALMAQLDSPVQWVNSMEILKQSGCSIFVECGPGRVLTGLLRAIDKTLQAFSTESTEAVSVAQEALLPARKEST